MLSLPIFQQDVDVVAGVANDWIVQILLSCFIVSLYGN